MSNSQSQTSSLMTIRLSIMMFLQFFAWGAWFATLGLALDSNGYTDLDIGAAYGTAPLAAMIAPLFLGLIADRFFPSQIVMAVLMLVGAGLMCVIAQTASPNDSDQMIWWMLAYMVCYMPTLGLGNTIAFTHISDQNQFPKIRVWGTIGWIVAGLGLGFAGWSASLNIFWLAAISSGLLGLYSFTLPHTPPPAKGTKVNLRALLMIDAMSLLAKPGFFVFALCSTLVCIPLGYYYGQTSAYLGAAGFTEPGSLMTVGQMSEIFFMILIPFFFRKLGVKMMLLIGMGAWVARYLLFACGATEQVTWMLLLGVALHGICYDFFFVTGFMYTDNKAPREIRGQAQSLLVFLTQGVGLFFGYRFAFGGTWPFTNIPLPYTLGTYGAVPENKPLADEITRLRADEPSKSAAEKLMSMFDKAYPDSLDIATYVEPTLQQWRDYWIYPAILAAGVFVLFALTFWDRMSDKTEN